MHAALSALLFICLLSGASAQAAPRVVVSIKPLHSLATAIMAGVGEPDVLLKGGGSPHAYSLRPSEARILDEAEVVFWIGPEFESFLDKPLSALTSKAVVVPVITAPNVKVIPARTAGLWEQREERADAGNDCHVWLDPKNAKAIAAAMERTLTSMDIANSARYRENFTLLAALLDSLDAEIRAQVAPVKDKPFIAFHDAYQYFEKAYGLSALGAITVSPDRAPGAKRVSELKEKIGGLGPVCVFTEPQFEPKLINTLVEGTPARAAVLDPEGTTLTAGPDLYFNLMRGLAGNFVKCLNAP